MASATISQGDERARKARNAVRGAFLGFFVDMFDIYLPIVVLAPALIYFISPELSPSATAIVGGSIFAATLIGRPIGALIFGHYADTIGRKRSTMIAVSGFGVVTLLIAFLPGYEQWGIMAVVIFVLLRFVDGIFLGGQYTAASPLAMEYSPKEKRGLYGSFISTGFALAYASISLLTMLLLFWIPAGGINSPYVQWGWRIPFVIGALMAFVFVIYYYLSVSESEVWEQSGSSEAPLKSLFRGQNLRSFMQVFVMMSGFWLALYTGSGMLPGLLGSEVGLSGTSFTITLVIAYVILAGGYLVGGVISQRVGRRPFLIAASVIMATVGTFVYWLLVGTAPQNLAVVIALTTIVILLVHWPWAIAIVYICERFQTGVRASGFGLGYSLAVILPAFYAYYQAGLATFMPFKFTPLPLVVLGALLILVGAMWGPETKDVDFEDGLEVKGAEETAGWTMPESSQTAFRDDSANDSYGARE